MPDLAIIIISYNTSSITKRCLDTVVQSLSHDPSLTTDIIVLDNNSPDDSASMLSTYAQKCNTSHSRIHMKVIALDHNSGFGKGNNEALEHTKAPVVLFLNSDTEALDDAIPQLYHQFMQSSWNFAGAHLINADKTDQLSVGRFYSLAIAFMALYCFGDRLHITRRSPSRDMLVDWVSGACFMTRREDFMQLKGFDPGIFMYWEEVDLFYRARKMGMKVGYFSKPTFIHLEGASSASRTAPIIKVFQGYIHFYSKHHSPLQVALIKTMLQWKARISIVIGKIMRNTYLVTTYTQAYEAITPNR